MNEWNSHIYAFFDPIPAIEYVDGRRVHVFRCNAKACTCKGIHGRFVCRLLDSKDAKSMSNLRRHAKGCWGDDAVESSKGVNVEAAREIIGRGKLRDGSLTAAFERIGKGKMTFSHRQHTTTEAR